MQEIISQTDRAKRQAHRLSDVSFIGDRKFTTATSEVNHQHRRGVDSQSGSEAKMNQTGLFKSGDDFYAPSCSRTDPFQKRAGISCVSQGAGRHYSHRISAGLLRCSMKSAKDLHSGGDGLGRKKSAAKNRLAQSSDFPIFVDFNEVVRSQTGNLQANRI